MTNTNTAKAAIKPVFRKQLPGGISAAVFENERDGRTYRSVNLQRSYKKNGQWTRMSMYLDHEHIPFIIEVLQSTWQFLNEHPASSVNAEENQDHAGDTLAESEDDGLAKSEFDA